MIDGLWEDGGDVSDAVLAGADALADAGEDLDGVGGAVVATSSQAVRLRPQCEGEPIAPRKVTWKQTGELHR